jgi:hypothetical protein
MAAVVGVAMVAFASAARADWNPGDPAKMHFPQLPDPFGWDVSGENARGGDDWVCTQTGPVSDIHLWLSWRDDNYDGEVANFTFSIWSNDPAGYTGVVGEDPGNDYSEPLEQLWSYSLDPNTDFNFTYRVYGTGVQGWYDPTAVPPVYLYENHNIIYQGNLTNIVEPFIQQQGQVYWLILDVDMAEGETAELGWKTADLDQYPGPYTGSIFMDGAVYQMTGTELWLPLMDPSGAQMDLAFVITPEPATMALMGIGLAVLVARRRSRKS